MTDADATGLARVPAPSQAWLLARDNNMRLRQAGCVEDEAAWAAEDAALQSILLDPIPSDQLVISAPPVAAIKGHKHRSNHADDRSVTSH